ncbi:hypothetical protein D3C73_978320 [compost metagenome]
MTYPYLRIGKISIAINFIFPIEITGTIFIRIDAAFANKISNVRKCRPYGRSLLPIAFHLCIHKINKFGRIHKPDVPYWLYYPSLHPRFDCAFTSLSPFRSHDNDPLGGPGSINGCRCSVFKHADIFDISRIDGIL